MTRDPSACIAALKAEVAATQDAAAALRAALLDTLINMGSVLLTTPEGRSEAAQTLLDQAERAHPAVAEVFREAAEKLRDEAGRADRERGTAGSE